MGEIVKIGQCRKNFFFSLLRASISVALRKTVGGVERKGPGDNDNLYPNRERSGPPGIFIKE